MSEIDRPIRAAVLTVSDRCSRGIATQTSGAALAEMLRTRLAAEGVEARCLDRIAGELPHTLRSFQAELAHYGVSSTVRVRRGIDIQAGCCQLRDRVVGNP